MKLGNKAFAVVISLALLLSVPFTAFAAYEPGEPAAKDVTADYVAPTTGGTVYSVDVAWGALSFTYNAGNVGAWNPDDHTYGAGTGASWSCETDADKITVTNHSNAAVSVGFDFENAVGYTTVVGSFTDNADAAIPSNTVRLDTAEGTTLVTAPSAIARLALSGTMPELADDTTGITVGTVTITITAVP